MSLLYCSHSKMQVATPQIIVHWPISRHAGRPLTLAPSSPAPKPSPRTKQRLVHFHNDDRIVLKP
ncbi:hypothetical protein SNOG_11505 [Parastagonospora nodorum SN15]|uniref:Uncharacterized protein n=1 Tax=Phaeosphaeria nodorum (strain SN15 / ATCC MYA-4574 / FGSC 10173) TaxID=321614 RepID=Q0U9Q9_PHANO|nr:hypothetical protein SNOG_11505 [Parastagonospora nodorum SN15]EAT81213.1 hypothetical protein SNOG_11505 [Parastagonospora nodorum SN15]